MTRRYLPLAAVLLVSACTNSPMPVLAPTDVPVRFEQPISSSAPLWPSESWWEGFGDPQLTALIARAQANNLDLYQAAARVRQADARARQAGAALLPTIGLNGSTNTFYGQASGVSQHETDYSTALGVSYDLDFWGKNRDLVSSADAARNATIADRATVALTVTAGVANTYFQLLALRDRIETARANLKSSQDILNIVERRVRAGYAANSDLTQERANMAAQQAALPPLEQQALEARSALATLLGIPPENFSVQPAQLADLTIPAVRPGLPSELLIRRPDIAAAEANLVAAHADLAAARKAFLPDITLTANGGVAYPALAAAVDTLPGFGLAANGAAALAQVIFDGGKTQGKIDETKAREDELLGAYRAAVIASFSDVENALGNVAHLSAQQAALEEQVAQAKKILAVARRKYTAGYADFLIVTDAQRMLYAARDRLADIRRARLATLVTLFKALGGGWQREPADRTAARN
jgi:NodT family efflux transporter outer membrane factor (OMF) lipoprotein